MKSGILIFMLMMFGSIASPQEHHTELLKLLKEYSDPHVLISANVYFSYHEHHHSTTPIDTMTSHLQMQGNNFHYTLRDHEYLKNATYYVTINHSDRLIFIDECDEFASPVFSPDQLNSVLTDPTLTIKSLGTMQGQKGFKLIIPNRTIESAELWFSEKNSLLSRSILFYGKRRFENEIHTPRVEIEYRNVKAEKSNLTAGIFSEKKFLVGAGKNFKPTSAFKNYKVISNVR